MSAALLLLLSLSLFLAPARRPLGAAHSQPAEPHKELSRPALSAQCEPITGAPAPPAPHLHAASAGPIWAVGENYFAPSQSGARPGGPGAPSPTHSPNQPRTKSGSSRAPLPAGRFSSRARDEARVTAAGPGRICIRSGSGGGVRSRSGAGARKVALGTRNALGARAPGAI